MPFRARKFSGLLRNARQVPGSRNAVWERLSLREEHLEQSGTKLTIPTKKNDENN